MKLEGRSIIVTGASRGIGAATAKSLARCGARVTLVARSGASIQAVAAEIREAGGQALAVRCDVGQEHDVIHVMRETVRAFGSVGGLINNAGELGARVPFDAYPVDDLRRCLEVNAVGTFLMTRAALPHLRGGRDAFVINISSWLGRHGMPDCAGYIAGKFALEGLTQALASEVASAPLAVVSVGPGMVATDMLAGFLMKSDLEGYRSPEEAAAALVALAEGLTPHDNGAVLDLFSE
ncbi:MAG: 2-deoxy-D-gluconate 3-dehydrogenase [Myxococcales bacterium]